VPEASLPPGWHADAHALWQAGQRQPAIDAVLAHINVQGEPKPLPDVLQLSYYVFLCGDPAGAAAFLDRVRPAYPRHPELLSNLAVCMSRGGRPAEAVERARELLAIEPRNVLAHDTICSALHQLGDFAGAAHAGTRALALKDGEHARATPGWHLPQGQAAELADRPGCEHVIAFSLWGHDPRYLRGAIHNALEAPGIYAGWALRFHVDETVPADVRAALTELGADVRLEAPGQPLRARLGWRFQVANDPAVGRFLVRDVDSVVNERERHAVDEWIASGYWFHAMRDWWTHTDLLLAGMWGGVAGVLPPLATMLSRYSPQAMETPNVDQWFLRDEIWRYVRQSCLVHDRCFRPQGSRPWPDPDPTGSLHVGQNVFAVGREAQQERFASCGERIPSLRLSRPAAK